MSRHSKNNTGSSIFTYGERQKLKKLNEWGEITSRIGADSQKKFEQCNLCLNHITNPVTCPKGHMYCKECILENFLHQKKKNKEKQAQFEEMNISKNDKLKKDHQQDKINKLKLAEDEFQKKSEKPEDNDNFENKQFVKAETKNCFWIPEQTPKNIETVIKKPKDVLLCPSSKPHPIKFKELISLNLTESKNDKAKFMCKICEKDLSIQKIVCLKGCGHVFCQKCLKLVCSKEEKCSICSKKYSPSEVINLQESGTSFSTHNSVMTNSFNPFFKY